MKKLNPNKIVQLFKELESMFLEPKAGGASTATYSLRTYRTDDVLVVETGAEIILYCAGTGPSIKEWLINFKVFRQEWLTLGSVHRGFIKNVEELAGRRKDKNSLLSLSSIKPITLVGHSRGSCIAMLLASYLGVSGKNIKLIVTCAPPRIGNKKFKKSYKEMYGDITHTIYSPYDLVSKIPMWGYLHGTIYKYRVGKWYSPKHKLSHYIEEIQKVHNV